MLEKEFEKKVKKFLKSLDNCYFLKTWGGGFQRTGIPDLYVCYNGKFLGIELKNETGKASELQKYDLKQIRKAGGYGYVVRPQNFEEFKKLMYHIGKLENKR